LIVADHSAPTMMFLHLRRFPIRAYLPQIPKSN
jgi:hypothetical protein